MIFSKSHGQLNRILAPRAQKNGILACFHLVTASSPGLGQTNWDKCYVHLIVLAPTMMSCKLGFWNTENLLPPGTLVPLILSLYSAIVIIGAYLNPWRWGKPGLAEYGFTNSPKGVEHRCGVSRSRLAPAALGNLPQSLSRFVWCWAKGAEAIFDADFGFINLTKCINWI
jgi:hypothetical protein